MTIARLSDDPVRAVESVMLGRMILFEVRVARSVPATRLQASGLHYETAGADFDFASAASFANRSF